MVNRFTTAQSTVAIRRWGPPAIVTLAAMAALTALSPDAAARQARPAPPTEATAPRDAGEPIMAIVSIKTQQVTFYDADGWILRAPVSTGVKGRETPAGVFAVIEKDKDHHSTMYDDAWMPNMQRITWNGIALHGGPLPGYAASHGCITDALRLCREAVRQDADRDAGDHRAERRGPGRVFPPRAIHAERGGHRGRSGACRDARPRGRGGRQGGRRGEESRRDSGARDSIAHGVAAQAGIAQEERRRRARVRRQGARRREDGPSQGAGRGPEAEGRRQGRGTGYAARHRQGRREVETRRRRRRKGRRQGGRDQEGRHRQGSDRGEARARAGLDLHQPRNAEALRAAQHA